METLVLRSKLDNDFSMIYFNLFYYLLSIIALDKAGIDGDVGVDLKVCFDVFIIDFVVVVVDDFVDVVVVDDFVVVDVVVVDIFVVTSGTRSISLND